MMPFLPPAEKPVTVNSEWTVLLLSLFRVLADQEGFIRMSHVFPPSGAYCNLVCLLEAAGSGRKRMHVGRKYSALATELLFCNFHFRERDRRESCHSSPPSLFQVQLRSPNSTFPSSQGLSHRQLRRNPTLSSKHRLHIQLETTDTHHSTKYNPNYPSNICASDSETSGMGT